eukprot:2818578-Lingulodinium_polyedra.AAC.1
MHRRAKEGITVGDLVFANKVVRKMQATATLPLRAKAVQRPMVFVGWSDASEAADPEGKAI